NLSACEDWFLAHKLKKEKIDLFSFIISRVASKSILDLKHPIGSYEFFEVLSQAIILSGMSMIISGSSRPASGSEHLISHAIDKYFPRSNLHGEQVAVATLFVTALRKQFDLLEILKNFYLTYGLPTNPSHLNLSKEEFLKAVLKAPNMRKERFTILNIVKKEELRKAYNVAFNDD
ncbi:MAG: iron-containing alcohol dehydrogenase, partial [Actinobacteria bacterium]|nr:iron-containing alcohol dehydrogenase [Actinomycetota bacterium]